MHDSAWARLAGVLFSPEKTFRSIAQRPTWLPPLLVLALLGTLLGFLISQRMDYREMFRERMAEQEQEVSEEQLEQMAEVSEKFGPVGALAGGLLFTPAIYLALAGIFLVAFRLLGSELEYQASLSTLLHGLMPMAVAALLSLPVVLGREAFTAEDTQRGVLLSNLGALAPEDAGPVVAALLASVDLFAIWAVVLLVIGYRVVARVSTAAAAGTVLAFWLLYVAGKAGLAAALG